MPVSKTTKQKEAKRRQLKITLDKAKKLLEKKDELHPVALAIVESVAKEEIEEASFYVKADPPATPEALIPVENIHVTTPKPKTWWENLWS